MNNLDKKYTELLQDILNNGVQKGDRTGTGTISVFGRQIRHKMSEGFPLLTTKKMYFKGIVTELLWFLRGDTNIKFLVDNNCHIWDGDAYKNYCKLWTERVPRPRGMGDQLKSSYEEREKWGKVVSVWRGDHGNGMMTWEDEPLSQEEFINKIKTDDEFANKWGELGPIYGAQWRSWKSASLEEQWGYGEIEGHPIGGRQYSKFNTNVHIDQIANLINDLKTNPDSRRLMVNAWNVGELDQMVLPPCHYGFQVYTRELTSKERLEISKNYGNINNLTVNWDVNRKLIDDMCDKWNVPTRAISLMWNQRSVDTFLGLPFNIASYGLLLEIIAEIVNMVPDELIGNLGDVHLYSNHIEQAKEQIGRDYTYTERWNMLKDKYGSALGLNHDRIEEEVNETTPARTREPFPLPKVIINGEFWNPGTPDGCGMGAGTYTDDIDSLIKGFELSDFQLENYQSHPAIKAPLSN